MDNSDSYLHHILNCTQIHFWEDRYHPTPWILLFQHHGITIISKLKAKVEKGEERKEATLIENGVTNGLLLQHSKLYFPVHEMFCLIICIYNPTIIEQQWNYKAFKFDSVLFKSKRNWRIRNLFEILVTPFSQHCRNLYRHKISTYHIYYDLFQVTKAE